MSKCIAEAMGGNRCADRCMDPRDCSFSLTGESMTGHPCKGMTQEQIDAFERIATNQSPGCTWPIIDALLKAGVIERGPDDTRRDAMGIYNVPSFSVPIGLRAQWCEWCSQQSENAPR